MAKKRQAHNPFRGYTIQEVFEAESCSSYVEIGGDVYCDDGNFALPNDKARQVYEKILVGLLKMINDGNDKERREGLFLLPTLFVRPLRIH